ncbi:hypothetical protein ASPWEDRAFT_26710 [Aspergillus wentii DTO 134E9]|uniref:Mitochondrial ATPase expression-domain-containing protein n=1 Tax=Aspergillus wentii DTO 134E9 TaxID=1073089 RepID=A0A1L9RQU5_ASPWE|nr:uncharacterized protein ASPWEDRAFT_26710 [Aspergillus wentii DTO 134E9]OJJ37309.1 hypothetical protein ASPWEDRAFT_26710 [Aspergillus wentii DTO 134E9]
MLVSFSFSCCLAGESGLLQLCGGCYLQWRLFASQSGVPPGPESLKHWEASQPRNGRRFAESRVSRPGLSTTDILEGGSTGSYDYEQEGAYEDESLEDIQDEASLKAIFYGIIQDGQPETILNALLDPRFEELVGSLPQTIFVEVFHLLSPAYFVDPYREIHRPLHPSAVDVKQYRSLDSIFDEFVNNLATVVNIRQSAGHTLGLAEYTHLLDCARSIGDAIMADSIWHNMREDEIYPDVRCYNYYMEAKVWDTAYTGREKYNLRMTPYAYRKRRFFNPNQGWQGYGTAGRSVRKEVLQIFNEMTEMGNHGDEATFINVILASSRVGHIKGMKNVLKTVWNVDIDALMDNVDESDLPEVTYYDRSSPLHPTHRLLFTVAHAFGTNNDIPAALKAIDFISRSYDLVVPEKVWLELFERSFVLSRPRFGPDAKRNAKGKVSYEFLNTMFQTMISPPFSVRPTIEIHHMLAKTAWDRARLSEFQYHMRAAYDLLAETRRKRRTARLILEGYLGGPMSRSSRRRMPQIDPLLLQSRALADAVNTYDILRLRTAQQTMIVERLARLLLIHHRWTGRDNPAWERCLLPQALEEWQDFLPQSFVYRTKGGMVQFRGATRWYQRNLTGHNRVPVRRPIGESDAALEAEASEIDDDFFWEKFRQKRPFLDLDSAPINRLYWETTTNKGEAFETTPTYWAEDTTVESDAFQHDPNGGRVTQKADETSSSFDHGHIPGPFSMA